MSRKPRGLRPDEQELWKAVTEKVTPLRPERPVALPPDMVKAPLVPEVANPRLPMFKLGQNANRKTTRHDLRPSLSSGLDAAPLQMDHKAFGKMRRGKLVPEARIDLHGMTLALAHPTLTSFILACHARQLRLVLVITGKGKPGNENGPNDDPMPTRRGVLKHQVPQWLSSAPIAPLILQVAQSHLRHGGTGAYYVYLRRHR